MGLGDKFLGKQPLEWYKGNLNALQESKAKSQEAIRQLDDEIRRTTSDLGFLSMTQWELQTALHNLKNSSPRDWN